MLSGVLLYSVMKSDKPKANEISFPQFLSQVNAGRVKAVTVTGSNVTGSYKDGSTPSHTTASANGSDLYKVLRDKGVDITVRDVAGPGYGWLSQLLPIVIIVIVGFWILVVGYLVGYLRGFRDKSLT